MADIARFVRGELKSGVTPELYVKTACVKARSGEVGEEVVTLMSDGFRETCAIVKNPDDMVITNPGGEEYIVSAAQFYARYEHSGNADVYNPLPVLQQIIPVDNDIEFTAAWGEKMSVRAGGVLNITDRKNIYGIQHGEFADTYAPLFDMIDNAAAVSFDVSDTLFFRVNPRSGRILANPDRMFRLMERHYDKRGFAAARIRAEREQRNLRTHRFMNHVKFEDIYENMPEQFQHMRPAEIQWELKNIRVNKQIKAYFDYCLDHGKTIAITSDMYLPAHVIRAQLECAGIFGYKKLYVSSDVNMSKHDGDIWYHIARNLNAHPDQILHIGDNAAADFDSARANGISGVLYKTWER